MDTLTATENLIGSVLLGRYRIVRELAKGGMGVVYLARSEGAVGFVKPVVVKLMLPEHASDERYLGMFKREAKILARLRHPSIVDVIEFGEENGAYVMVLQYVRGYHLGQWHKYLRKRDRKIPAEILLLLMADVLEALDKAHTMTDHDGTPMQIVHRDVSPSNILLDEDGRARLLDFGVARMRGGAVEYQTQVKSFVGKLTYSAPEVFSGIEATPQSDLYSCGVVLHESLLGRNVFNGKNQAATLNLVLNHTPDSVEAVRPDAPPGIDAILRKAMAKAPENRFASARELASALRKLQREPESEVRVRFAAMLKSDFGDDMANALGIESLSARDEAWRRLSLSPDVHSLAHGDLEQTGGLSRQRRQSLRPPGESLRPPSDQLRQSTDSLRSAAAEPGHEPELKTVYRSARWARVEPPPSEQVDLLNPPAALLAPPPVPQAAILTAASPVPQAQAPIVASPVPAGQQSRALIVALAVVACLAIVAIVLSLRPHAREAAALPPAIRLVTERQPPPPTVVEHSSEPPTAETPDAPDAPAPKKPRAAPRSTEPDAASLTRAFRRQQANVEACFTKHTRSLEGMPRMQIEFDLDQHGKASRVAVLPASIDGTPLGHCLREVGKNTRFPSQGQPVSFTIPITTSRGG